MGHELGELARHADARRRRGADRGYLVQEVGEPHELLVVGEVYAPHGVVDYLVADVYLLGQRFLGEVEQRGAYLEVLVELVLGVEAEQCLALHGEH